MGSSKNYRDNMKKKNLKYFSLNNDPITKGVTTFKNYLGNSIVAFVMPSDFKEWETVTITYQSFSKVKQK